VQVRFFRVELLSSSLFLFPGSDAENFLLRWKSRVTFFSQTKIVQNRGQRIRSSGSFRPVQVLFGSIRSIILNSFAGIKESFR